MKTYKDKEGNEYYKLDTDTKKNTYIISKDLSKVLNNKTGRESKIR